MNDDLPHDDRHYLVTWVMDFWAGDPVEAAQQARAVQLDPESVATCFNVQHVKTGVQIPVDLEDEPDVPPGSKPFTPRSA